LPERRAAVAQSTSMGAIIQTLIYSSEELQPYSVPDPTDPKNDALRISVPWKVFFQYDIDSLLVPNGPIGTYRIEFLPQGRDPISVIPEPKQTFPLFIFQQDVRKHFPEPGSNSRSPSHRSSLSAAIRYPIGRRKYFGSLLVGYQGPDGLFIRWQSRGLATPPEFSPTVLSASLVWRVQHPCLDLGGSRWRGF